MNILRTGRRIPKWRDGRISMFHLQHTNIHALLLHSWGQYELMQNVSSERVHWPLRLSVAGHERWRKQNTTEDENILGKLHHMYSFYVLLTVHLEIIMYRETNLMHNLFFVCSVNLYMFRAYLGPSSGGTTICLQQFVLIVLFRWMSVVLVALFSKQDTRQSSKKNNKYQLLYTYSCTSWWWA